MTAFRIRNILSNNTYLLAILSFSILFFFSVVSFSSAGQAPAIKLIEIKGNRKISSETIHSKMKSKVGSHFFKKDVQDDIKEIYNIGYFNDVRVEIDSFEGGIKLVFILIEKPTIISLDFQGNEEIETDDLKDTISITSGAVANLSLITDNIQKIVSYYQSEGYWLAKIFPVIREVSKDAVALTFQVEEGPKVKIRGVSIEGNSAFPSKKIIKLMETRKHWFMSWLTGSGTYEKEQIQIDIEKISSHYHNNGYINIAISEPKITLSPDKKSLFITLVLSEGEQYSTGELKIKGNSIFTSAELFELISISPGSVFNRGALRADIDKILDFYMERGYARADINPLISVNPEKKTTDIIFSITEGGIFRIGRVNISGNTKTRDKVIRREVRLDEGEIFNKKLIKRSYQRLSNLNFFETIDLRPIPKVEEKLIDLNIDVTEKMTGMMSVGGGYSSIDQFVFMTELSQANLLGKGLNLKLKVDLSARRSNYRISLTDPWFMDKPISASFSIYKDVYQYPDYDKDAKGGSIGFGKELSEYVGGKIVYNIEDVEISDISDDASDLISEQAGKKLTSSISPSIWRDTRDSRLEPTTGSRNALHLTIAGLGGDNYFIKGLADSSRFFPVINDQVFSIRGRFGYASGFNEKQLPLYERFYVGGINTIRGLGFGEGGPRNEEEEKIGGEKELIFNAEYIIPIVKDIRLKGVLFYDYGTAFTDSISFGDMRSTAGFGVRWISPLGPIRLEWGFNLEPKEDESNNKIEFSLGGFF